MISLPGDTVRERNGCRLGRRAAALRAVVAPGHRDHETGSWHVQQGSYFLLGDNRAESCDSRAFGAVPKRNVVGRVVLVYWPPSRLGFR